MRFPLSETERAGGEVQPPLLAREAGDQERAGGEVSSLCAMQRAGGVALLLIVLMCAALPGCGPKPAATASAPAAGKSAFYFTDVTAKAGITWQRSLGAYGGKLFPEAAGGGGAFIDYDNDGYLDVLLINGDWWPGHPLPGPRPTMALYHNNHDGTFTDVSARMGMNISLQGMGVAVAITTTTASTTCW